MDDLQQGLLIAAGGLGGGAVLIGISTVLPENVRQAYIGIGALVSIASVLGALVLVSREVQ